MSTPDNQKSSKRMTTRETLRALQTELDSLKRDGVLSSDQVARILDRFETPTRGGEFGSLVFLATTTLGVLALGFAAFLVLRYNWAALSGTVKTAIVCGATALAYFGAALSRRFNKTVLAEAFTFGGAIMFGVDVWQLAQIYQFDVDFPQGAWIWAFGVFLLALFSRLPALHFFAAALIAVWGGWNFFADVSIFQNNDVSQTLARASFSAPIFAAIGYVWSVRRRYPSVASLYVLLFAFWAIFQPLVWTSGVWFYYEIFVGGLLWYFGDRLARNRAVAETAKFLGAAFVLGFLIPATFPDAYNDFDFFADEKFVYPNVCFAAIYGIGLALLAAASILVSTRNRRQNGLSSPHFWSVATSPSGIALGMLISLLVFQLLLQNRAERFAAHYANVLSIAVAWFFICSGAAGKPARYWIGVLYFVAWSLIQYCSLFGGFGGTLSAAVCFATLALALFFAAFVFQTKIRGRIESPQPDSSSELNDDAEPQEPPQEPGATVLKIGTCAVVALQFALIFGVVAVQTARFSNAQTILVETVPLDPSCWFRGDYIILNYPFSNSSGTVYDPDKRETVKVFDVSGDLASDGRLKSRIVFVRLKRDAADGVFKPIEMTSARPQNVADDEIVLRGRRKRYNQVVYGIEAFFLQEGTGREIEDATRFGSNSDKKALVKLRVAENGQARVADVELVDAPDEDDAAPELETVSSDENP